MSLGVTSCREVEQLDHRYKRHEYRLPHLCRARMMFLLAVASRPGRKVVTLSKAHMTPVEQICLGDTMVLIFPSKA